MKEYICIDNITVLPLIERRIPGSSSPNAIIPIRNSVFCNISLVFPNHIITDDNVPLLDTIDELIYNLSLLTKGSERDVCIMAEPVFFGVSDGETIDAFLLKPESFDENMNFTNYLGRWNRSAALNELEKKKRFFESLYQVLT